MKRALLVFMFFLVLLLALSGALWQYRDGLERNPGDDNVGLRAPQAAFPLSDGGFVMVDSNAQRLLRFNARGLLEWKLDPLTRFGRFIALDVAPDGLLYGIDEKIVAGIQSFGPLAISQRLVCISQDGGLVSILLEREVVSGSGFIPGSLRVHDDQLWYLYDDGAASFLATLDPTSGSEQRVGRTDWRLNRASLAPGGPGGAIAVATEGGLAIFQRDRFETLSEYSTLLPYPTCVRYDNKGRLYVSDPVAGLILRISPGDEPEEIVSVSSGAAYTATVSKGSILASRFTLDNFSLGPEGLVLLDSQYPSVLVVDPESEIDSAQATIVRELSDFTITKSELKRSWLAWAFLAGSLASGLGLLIALVHLLVSFAPKPLALLGAALPGLISLVLVMALAWHAGELRDQSALEAAGFERLRTAAVVGAGALPGLNTPRPGLARESIPGILAKATATNPADAVHPRYSEGWENLRRRLAAMVDLPQLEGWPPVSGVLYFKAGGNFRYICDSDGLHIPGMAQPLEPPAFEVAVSQNRAVAGVVFSGGQRWLSVVTPLRTALDEPVILLEMTAPVLIPGESGLGALKDAQSGTDFGGLLRLLLRHLPELRPGFLFGVYVLALVVFIAFPLLTVRRFEASELMAYRELLARLQQKKRAVLALRSGDLGEAIQVLETFAWKQPPDTQALNNLGAAYAQLGRLDDARNCFKAVLSCEPGNGTAGANLVKIEERQAQEPASSRKIGGTYQ